jgi:hypothetical protein
MAPNNYSDSDTSDSEDDPEDKKKEELDKQRQIIQKFMMQSLKEE